MLLDLLFCFFFFLTFYIEVQKIGVRVCFSFRFYKVQITKRRLSISLSTVGGSKTIGKRHPMAVFLRRFFGQGNLPSKGCLLVVFKY